MLVLLLKDWRSRGRWKYLPRLGWASVIWGEAYSSLLKASVEQEVEGDLCSQRPHEKYRAFSCPYDHRWLRLEAQWRRMVVCFREQLWLRKSPPTPVSANYGIP